MHRFIIPERRAVLGFFQEAYHGGSSQRHGLSPWGAEAKSLYFAPVAVQRSAVRAGPCLAVRSVCIFCSWLFPFPFELYCSLMAV